MKLSRRHRRARGFSLVEVLIALAITSTLLTATLVALDASVRAYQSTIEEVSSNSIGRLVLNRLLTMIRTGTEFGPYPTDPRVSTIQSDSIEFRTQSGQIVRVLWDRSEERLTYSVDGGTPVELLDGVVGTQDELGNLLAPFTLVYTDSRQLYRASIDLTIEPDDIIDLGLEGDRENNQLRLIGSAMPRVAAF